jgi:hypothetical protein
MSDVLDKDENDQSAYTDKSKEDVEVTFEFVIREEQGSQMVSTAIDVCVLTASSLLRCADTLLAGVYQYREKKQVRFEVPVPAEVAPAWSADLVETITEWYQEGAKGTALVLPGEAELCGFLQVPIYFSIFCVRYSARHKKGDFMNSVHANSRWRIGSILTSRSLRRSSWIQVCCDAQ